MYCKINSAGTLEVYPDEEDICYNCCNILKCPLVASLQNEVVILRYEHIEIMKCAMFKKEEGS